MFEPDQYQLVDFGRGRKVERFATVLVDRPSPAADRATMADPANASSASMRFEAARGGEGRWTGGEAPAGWAVSHGSTRLELGANRSGNLGVFPEQAENWDWIAEQVRRCRPGGDADRPKVLNLFAYTGAATLAAAGAGSEVTHIDSSAPTVAWARRNAEASGMADLPIRWLVEDALKFVRREVKRGNRYHGIIADPPTYGHGPKGKAFKFAQHVPELMGLCGELLSAPEGSAKDEVGRFLVFSCHAPGVGPNEAATLVDEALRGTAGMGATGQPLVLKTADGRELPAGVSARWSSGTA